MLPPHKSAEAIAKLEATGDLPADPYIHFQEAQVALLEQGLGQDGPDPHPAISLDQALASLHALQKQDPENALPYFMEATARFYAGDQQGALAALNKANARTQAWPYTSNAAIFDAQALQAAGMSPDAAQAVAALNAGSDQYRFLLDLSTQLLNIGSDYMNTDSQTAQTIFNSVDTMGQQLQQSANYSYEQLAGLDIQRQAIQMFWDFSQTLLVDPSAQTTVTNQAEALRNGFQDLQTILTTINSIFLQDMSNELMNSAFGVILQQGDLKLPSYFGK